MKLSRFILAAATALLFSTCKKDGNGCFTSAGKESSLEIKIDDFNVIEGRDRLVLHFKQDTTKEALVTIKGGENIIKNVSAKVENGILRLEDHNQCNWVRDYSKKIHVEISLGSKNLHKLSINDACTVEGSDTLKLDSLLLEQLSTEKVVLNMHTQWLFVNGKNHGEVVLAGTAAIFVSTLYDAGKLSAQNFTGDYVYVYHYGINEAHVRPYKLLGVHLHNKGNIFYYSDPLNPLQVDRTGNGNLIRR